MNTPPIHDTEAMATLGRQIIASLSEALNGDRLQPQAEQASLPARHPVDIAQSLTDWGAQVPVLIERFDFAGACAILSLRGETVDQQEMVGLAQNLLNHLAADPALMVVGEAAGRLTAMRVGNQLALSLTCMTALVIQPTPPSQNKPRNVIDGSEEPPPAQKGPNLRRAGSGVAMKQRT